MDKLVDQWRSTLSDRERALHDMAAVKLKKVINSSANDHDQGSYFPERSKAFQAWLKTQPK